MFKFRKVRLRRCSPKLTVTNPFVVTSNPVTMLNYWQDSGGGETNQTKKQKLVELEFGHSDPCHPPTTN